MDMKPMSRRGWATLTITAIVVLFGGLVAPAAAQRRARDVTESVLHFPPLSDALTDGWKREVIGPTIDGRLVRKGAPQTLPAMRLGDFASTVGGGIVLAQPSVSRQGWQSIYANVGPQPEKHANPGALILAGTLGAIGGIYLGAHVGFNLVRSGAIGCNCGEDPGLEGAIVGAVIGSGVLSALATRLGNRSRGGLGKSLGRNLLVSGVALAVAHETGAWGMVAFAPFVHIILAVP